MDSASQNKSFQPRPFAELLPELSGILTRESMQTLTAKKQPRKIALTSTVVRDIKPLTVAEMKRDMLVSALKHPSPRRCAQPAASSKKKMWNSSVKVDKTKSHTAGGRLKNNSVRKVLNFQTKAIPNNPETPKFTKPEVRVKKSVYVQAKSTVRISGVFNMPETPVINNKLNKNRMTLAIKENLAPRVNVNLKQQTTPLISKKSQVPPIPNTPLSNISWKSDSDTSFLKKEKELEDIEDKVQAIANEPTLERIAEVSPPVSTPFKEYRNVQEFFNHTDETDNSALYNDNTIMCFDKVSNCEENSKREESVIVSLCDLLNKASVTKVDHTKAELNDLLQFEKQLEDNIKIIENEIKNLDNIKESQLHFLQYIKKLINEKRTQKAIDEENKENNNQLVKVQSMPKLEEDIGNLNELSPVSNRMCSVIKSPSYIIPKKNSCLRKKILHKSMPNVSDGLVSERTSAQNKDMDKRALDMYMGMKMKEQMNFLNTPCSKRKLEVPDTPAVTSYNLQMQLDKIYKDNT